MKDSFGNRRWVRHLSHREVKFLIGRTEKLLKRDARFEDNSADQELLTELKRELSYRP